MFSKTVTLSDFRAANLPGRRAEQCSIPRESCASIALMHRVRKLGLACCCCVGVALYKTTMTWDLGVGKQCVSLKCMHEISHVTG